MLTALKNCFDKKEVNPGRQPELDLAKGFAIIFMVWVHVFEELSPSSEGGLYTFVEILGGPFAAPVFMICMGIGMNFTKHNSPKDFAKRGHSLLWIGIVLNIFRFVIPDVIKYALLGNKAFLWNSFQLFSVDILQFAGLAFLFFAMMKKLKVSNLVLSIIGLATSMLGMALCKLSSGNYVVDQFLGYIWGTEVRSYFPFLSWIIFPIFGYLFSFLIKRCRDKKGFYIRVCSVAAVIMIAYLVMTLKLGLMFLSDGSYYHLSTVDALFFCVLAVLVFGICYLLTQVFSKCKFTAMNRFSRNINTIYCIHWTLIGVLGVIQAVVFRMNTLSFLGGTVLAAVLLIVSDRLAVLYLERIKPWLRARDSWRRAGNILLVLLFAGNVVVNVIGLKLG